MKPSQILLFGASPTLTYTWKVFTPSIKIPLAINEAQPSTPSPLDLNPTKILESTQQKPSFYAAAMLELKRLEEKPICHRMAAQLLVKNCQGLRDLEVHEYQVASESMQRHHVESFAASLAMCDMARARFDIPDACLPFKGEALETALHTNGRLDVTPDNISACLEGLGQDHSHWSTWLSYRDTSLLLCRGASVDVEKDQALKLQKQFVQMMEEFTTDLYSDLQELRRQMDDHTQESNKLYKESKKQVETFRTKVQETLESVTERIKNVNLGVESIMGGAKDVDRMIRNLVNTMVQSNAEMAAEQEKAISVTTKNLKTSLGGINDLVASNEGKLANMHDVVMLMATTVGSLVERQNAIEESSLKTLHALLNTTELMQAHSQTLTHASLQASKISAELENVSSSSQRLGSSWASRLDWAIRTVLPVVVLFGGNVGTVPTMGNNLLLLAIGYGAAESVIMMRALEWSSTRSVWRKETDSTNEDAISSSPSPSSSSSEEEPAWKGRIPLPNLRQTLVVTSTPDTSNEHGEMI